MFNEEGTGKGPHKIDYRAHCEALARALEDIAGEYGFLVGQDEFVGDQSHAAAIYQSAMTALARWKVDSK